MTVERVPCLVPFCRRSIRRQKDWSSTVEWLCADHWRLVDRRLKVLRTKFRKRVAKLKRQPEYRRGMVHLCITRHDHTDALIWKRMRTQAIERAAGIA